MGKKEALVDFKGQILVERIFQVTLIVFGVISFIVGYATKSLQLLVAINVVGLLITLVLVVPPWPMFRANPVKWQEKKEKMLDGLMAKKSWWQKLF
ncbi:SPC12-domain-containing protein [Rhizoclosmatium globosum]|uniref:Signal peptidase complex subunit 1 n=1 Tax=Rhizoclosmatium globosum TaxID=329046 RepID=A0A1Y2BP73_9FUNG|nr:SPC12-domain-containing protein [Rhizoclosmatium globosum]|eukprot:ORY36549.1 SPC12-domain-containing protein [Rhizoclosmatium globosum]